MNPQFQLMFEQALHAFQGGYVDRADSLLTKIISLDKKNPNVLHLLGLIRASQGNFKEAVDLLTKAAQVDPCDGFIQYNLAKALVDSGQILESIPYHIKAVELMPNNPDAWINYGKTVSSLKRYEEAIGHYDRALSLKQDYLEAWINKGIALHELKRYEEAIAHYDRALELSPDYVEAWTNKGAILHELKRYEEAIAHYDRALELSPEYLEAWTNKGAILHELKRYEEAIAHYDRALELSPDYVEAWTNKGISLKELKRYEEAIAHYDRALNLKPDTEWIMGDLLLLNLQIYHHQNLDKNIEKLITKINSTQKVITPFALLALADNPMLHKQASKIFSEKFFNNTKLKKIQKNSKKIKIRLGYFSPDFSNHPVAHITSEFFELQDKNRFELFAFSLMGATTNDINRLRLEKSFDHFINIENMMDQDIAKLARKLEIDISIDLCGYTQSARPAIFSYGTAPIQVNWLGYPGTLGSKNIDYIIGDSIVIPHTDKSFYTEKIVYMPDVYMPDDSKRIASKKVFLKSEFRLPEDMLIFCSFNSSFKFNKLLLNSWARILNAVKNSVLWIPDSNEKFKENLLNDLNNQGINSTRIIFSNRMESMHDHLARYKLVDICLDTYPYNSHSTALDALKNGVPLVARMGKSFHSRVSASLLHAIGMPELITNSEEEYEALAIALATDPPRLKAIKQKLKKNCLSSPLFDSHLFTKNIEKAYIKMYERNQQNLPPDHITID